MPRTKKPELRFPLKLTWGQRKMLAYADPGLTNRLKLDEPNQRLHFRLNLILGHEAVGIVLRKLANTGQP